MAFMIKVYTAIAILLFLVCSCDNEEISALQQESFIKFYGSGLEDAGMKVLTTNEGYLIMGTIKNADRGKDICIIRTDKFGNSIAPIKVFGNLWDDQGYAIKPTDTNGYIIVGSTLESESSEKKDVYMVQINEEGDTLWTKKYGRSNFDDEARDVLVLDNTNIVLAGYTDTTAKNKDFLLMETDAAGNLIKKIRSTGTNREEEAYSIVQSTSNYYLLAGYSYERSGSNLYKNICVIRWSGTGSPYKKHDRIGTSSYAAAIRSAGPDEYYMACTVYPTATDESMIYMIKIQDVNDSLKYVMVKSFGERAKNIVSDFAIDANSLYAVGTSTNGESTGDMLILETSLSGGNPSYFYTGDGASYLGNGFDFTPDGGYIITGANFINTNNSVITLCKLNAEGTLR